MELHSSQRRSDSGQKPKMKKHGGLINNAHLDKFLSSYEILDSNITHYKIILVLSFILMSKKQNEKE